MQVHLSADFNIKDWREAPIYPGDNDSKVTRAIVVKQYSGDIEGSSTTEWLMACAEEGDSATFVGLERVSGSVSGRQGSLILRHIGSYHGIAAKGAIDVVKGAGSGELQSVAGSGRFLADPDGSVTLDLTLDEEFEAGHPRLGTA